MKPVREGERRSRRKLGLAPEFKASDLPVRTRRPKVLVQAPQPVPVVQTPLFVPVEPTTPEQPRELVVAAVASPVASSYTAGVHSPDVHDEAMAAIDQVVVGKAPCLALELVVAEHVLEAIEIPVVPVAPAPQRGWRRWCLRAALVIGNMIVNDSVVFLNF